MPCWQCSSVGQSLSTLQFTGGGTMQKPARQTSFGGQSPSVMQPPGFSQTCVMHLVGGGHWLSRWQKRVGWQTVPTQVKPAAQSASEPQVNGWQKPKSQRCPAGQSPSVAQFGCGAQMRVPGVQNCPGGHGLLGPQPTTGSHW